MMKDRTFRYEISTVWTQDDKHRTPRAAYTRDYVITSGSKPSIAGSADPAFQGDASRWNPEELLVASIAACHQLWYLYLCAAAGIIVVEYRDEAMGIMVEESPGRGHFASVMLRPRVVIRAGGDLHKAMRFHQDAHAKCYIATSVNFPITCEAAVKESVPGSICAVAS